MAVEVDETMLAVSGVEAIWPAGTTPSRTLYAVVAFLNAELVWVEQFLQLLSGVWAMVLVIGELE